VSVVQRVLPSVVQITTNQGLGSGVVLDTKGNIVTNAHVVGNATTFQVRLPGSSTPAQATLKGTYRPDDLAVITLEQPPADLHPATFGDSTKLAIGDIVLAMGNPLGLTGSVTNGIVSATGRIVSEPSEDGAPGVTLPDVVQTSAAINPGNSGGALVDLTGAVVGIPTLTALSPAGGGAGAPAPGIGLAIPSNIVTDITGQIVQNGKVVNSHRAALGVGVITVVGSDGQPAGAGVGVVEPGGPAAAAGFQPGDVITGINGKPVRSAQDLTAALAAVDPGQKVPVDFTDRQGARRTVTVTLGQLPGS
jgi:S1-C subfamily serine protease